MIRRTALDPRKKNFGVVYGFDPECAFTPACGYRGGWFFQTWKRVPPGDTEPLVFRGGHLHLGAPSADAAAAAAAACALQDVESACSRFGIAVDPEPPAPHNGADAAVACNFWLCGGRYDVQMSPMAGSAWRVDVFDNSRHHAYSTPFFSFEADDDAITVESVCHRIDDHVGAGSVASAAGAFSDPAARARPPAIPSAADSTPARTPQAGDGRVPAPDGSSLAPCEAAEVVAENSPAAPTAEDADVTQEDEERWPAPPDLSAARRYSGSFELLVEQLRAHEIRVEEFFGSAAQRATDTTRSEQERKEELVALLARLSLAFPELVET